MDVRKHTASVIKPGFSRRNPSASNPCSKCAKEKAGWSFDWCVFSAMSMLVHCQFSCLPLTPHLSPIMGAREYGFDEDRYLSRLIRPKSYCCIRV